MPSIRDVAQKAGVAIATVSAALNHTAPVSEATRRRVLDAANALGYKPNSVARSLRQGQTRLIALVVADITNPFFGALARAVENHAAANDFAVMLCDTNEDAQRERDALELLREQRVAGAILTPCGHGPAYAEELQKMLTFPVVLVDRAVPGLRRDHVGLDSFTAGRIVTEYLMRLGHRRIGFVGGIRGLTNAELRRAGFEAALGSRGLPVEPGLVIDAGFRGEQAHAAVQELLMRSDRPSAIVAANNVMALGCMQAMRDLHFRCPGDLSLAGIDDMPWSTALSPPLTAVAQPIDDIAGTACAQLFERIGGLGYAAQEARETLLPPALMVRESCAVLA